MVNCAALLPLIAGLFSVAQAHSRVWGLWADDVYQGDGIDFYIRSPPLNSPVKDLTKDDIICNTNNVAVHDSVNVNASQKVTFEWYHNTRGDDIIDASHKGPITVWIADASTNGAGGVWTKLYESGLENGVWAVQNLISNKGKVSVTLPSTLAPGDYLLRAEIIALHEADTDYRTNNARGAQFYPSCSQIKVVSGGTAKPPGTFAFVGGYTPTDPGILYSLYAQPLAPYPIPGPKVWDGTGGTTGSKVQPKDTTPKPSTPSPSPTPGNPTDTNVDSTSKNSTMPDTNKNPDTYKNPTDTNVDSTDKKPTKKPDEEPIGECSA